MVTGIKALARSEDRKCKFTFLLSVLVSIAGFSPGVHAAEYYVTPTGANSGDGTLERPWNLGFALKGPEIVQPGDTIWLRGGVYRANNRPSKYFSQLQGSPGNPIIVRQFPGERAIIDGSLSQLSGGWVHFWGFEIMNTLNRRSTGESGPFPKAFHASDGRGKQTDFAVSGFDARAPGVKLINLLIHDSIGGGIVLSTNAIDPEIHGTFAFHNGWQGGDRGHGHGLYAQNVSPSVAVIENNLFFENFALGAQATGTGSLVDNFQFRQNVFFFNSNISRQHQGNLVIGPFEGQARDITLSQNYFFETIPSGTDVNIGYVGGIQNGLVNGNYFATRVHFSPANQNVQVNNNINVDVNTAGEQPNQIDVIPNKFEPGRAHIVVFNWQELPEVSADLNGILPPGTAYEIRNAQDILGPPVTRGVFAGSPVILPMTGLSVAKPLLANPVSSTAPRFNVFVVLPQATVPATGNSTPILPTINNRTIAQNTATPLIRFRVRDAELPPQFLNLSVNSSNPELVPHENIVITGAAATRSMRITPVAGKTGSTIIKLSLSDGLLSTNTSFTVTVQ